MVKDKEKKVKNGSITVRLDDDVKKRAEIILSHLGLKPADAIRTFYKQITLQKGLPYQVKIPNEETMAAIDEANTIAQNLVDGKIGSHSSVDDLFDSL